MKLYNIALIPARSGSKSILDKNILKLHGHPLLSYSIAAAKLSKNISRVVVSTDSRYYANIASKYGAEVPFLRPKNFARDTSTDKEFLVHALKFFSDNEQKVPDIITHLRPTTPLRCPAVIDNAIDLITKNKASTSLRSGHKAPESPFKWFKKNNKGYFEGLINKNEGIENFNLPKEFFDPVFVPNGYVDIVKTVHLLNNDNIHGDKIIGFETDICTEIDCIEEFNYVDYQIKAFGTKLLNYLKKY